MEPAAETTYDESTLNATVSTKATGNLIWSDNLEGSSYFSSVPSVQTATSYAITTVTNPVYQGSKAARFELRDTDAENHSGTRSEISFNETTNLNRWYSYALYAPSAYYKADAEDEIITQWHQGGGLTPALCLRVKSDKLYIRILGTTWVELCNFDKDQWHAYVMHIKHSSSSDGLIEIWKDGVKIMIGLMPVFALAAFFEGFITRLYNDVSVLTTIITSLSVVFVIWYFVIYPVRLGRKMADQLNEEEV